jgi:hypothetical protein
MSTATHHSAPYPIECTVLFVPQVRINLKWLCFKNSHFGDPLNVSNNLINRMEYAAVVKARSIRRHRLSVTVTVP